MLVLDMSFRCNATCPNCPYRHSQIREKYDGMPFMPISVFKRIADEAGAYEGFLRLTGGGEPTLHPDIVPFIWYAIDAGCDVSLITNGSGLTYQKVEQLVEMGINMIEFSVDAGTEEDYKKARGLNWEHINLMVEDAMNLRKKYRSKTRIIASVIKAKDIDYTAAESYWQKRVDKVQMREFLTWGYLAGSGDGDLPKDPCPHLYDRLSIDTRGNVTVCSQDIAYKHKFGNVMDTTIRHLWKSIPMELMRQKHEAGIADTIPMCRNCEDRRHKQWGKLYWDFVEKIES